MLKPPDDLIVDSQAFGMDAASPPLLERDRSDKRIVLWLTEGTNTGVSGECTQFIRTVDVEPYQG